MYAGETAMYNFLFASAIPRLRECPLTDTALLGLADDDAASVLGCKKIRINFSWERAHSSPIDGTESKDDAYLFHRFEQLSEEHDSRSESLGHRFGGRAPTLQVFADCNVHFEDAGVGEHLIGPE